MAAPALFADAITDVYDGQIRSIEREVLGLAQKMPADKYDFAPTNGAYAGVRTFGQQVRHIATVMYMISASVLNEDTPVEIGPEENGREMKTKDEIIKYFQDAIAYSHKAMGSLTQQNMLDRVKGMGGGGTTTRVAAAAFMGAHTYDHYGQMVVYARANGVVPGNAPPPGAKGKGKGK
jgi:uncharacterized damage-inducible protein DinB